MTRPEEFGIDAFDKKDDQGNPIPGSGIDAASEQITTLADRIARAQSGGGPAPSTTQPMTEIVTIDTQEEFDALPPGSQYIDKSDGITYTKPT